MVFHHCAKWLLSLISKLILYFFCWDIFTKLRNNILQKLNLGKILTFKFQKKLNFFKVKVYYKKFINLNPHQKPYFLSLKKKKKKNF